MQTKVPNLLVLQTSCLTCRLRSSVTSLFSYLSKALLNAHHLALDRFFSRFLIGVPAGYNIRPWTQNVRTDKNNCCQIAKHIKIYKFIAKDAKYSKTCSILLTKLASGSAHVHSHPSKSHDVYCFHSLLSGFLFCRFCSCANSTMDF